MRAKDAARLSTIRLLLAAIKQKEVDERSELTDAEVLAVIDKMVKQRRDSIAQFEAGGREDLADIEKPRSACWRPTCRSAMSEAEIEAAIAAAIADAGAAGAAGHGQGDGDAQAASSPAAPTWRRCPRR